MVSKHTSIIVPIFNGKKHLAVFWESLKEHLNIGYELIMIDDGSEQNIKEVFEGWKDIPISWIRNEHPLGFARAVNQGIKIASGSHIFILNSDLIIKNDVFSLLKANAYSGRNRPVIPLQIVHPFRCKSATQYGRNRPLF